MRLEGHRQFNSVVVVGAAGQTGRLYARSFAEAGVHVIAVLKEEHVAGFNPNGNKGNIDVSTDLLTTLKHRPDALVLATQNPTKRILEVISEGTEAPLTVILPQNGVNIMGDAEEAINGNGKNLNFIRASLFTVVSNDKEGEIVFNADKKRIAIAPITQNGDKPSKDNLQITNELFVSSGFRTYISKDPKSMEWTKLIANLLGSTSTITGLTPKETFQDPELLALEHKALKDRFAIMEAAGIPVADIPWVAPLRWARLTPTLVLSFARNTIAGEVAKARNNQPSAAEKQISAGAKSVEAKDYYHKPILDLADEYKLDSPVDRAIHRILDRHKDGIIDLATMDHKERRELLLDVVSLEMQEPFTKRDPWWTDRVKAITQYFTNSLTIKGAKNLQEAVGYLGPGRNVIIKASHQSHADHPIVLTAMEKALGLSLDSNSPIFVGGQLVKKEMIARVFGNPFDLINVATVKEKASDHEKWLANILNKKTLRVLKELFKKGVILIMYPEGTRSRTGEIGKAVPGSSLYDRYGVVVHVAIKGTREILVPDGAGKDNPPLVLKILRTLPLIGKKLQKLQWPNHADVSIAFGKPIYPGEPRAGDMEEITELSKKL